MFGIRFIKVQPTDFILQFRKGKPVREGPGLSFFYFAPTSTLVLVPMGSVDIPFIFEEVTRDFQQVTVQGQITYRVAEPKRLAGLMNFALQANARAHASDDPLKVPQRLVNHARVLARASLKALSLREALAQSDAFVTGLEESLRAADGVQALGIEVLGLTILAIRPTPETARALEAEAREGILREADEAIYARRNAAIEQERAIKENELDTEIALEARKKELVALASANARDEANAKAYALSAILKAFNQVDPKVLQSVSSVGMDPGQLVAMAFREMAERAEKIGQLNVSPDLLRELLSTTYSSDEETDGE